MALEEYFQDNPFVNAVKPPEVAKSTGAKRLAALAVKGATLGLAGARHPAEGFLEHATEFVGSVPTIAGVSAVASPAAAAGLRAAKLAANPITTRLTSAAATGGLVGSATSVGQGTDPLMGAATGAAEFVAGEGAFLGLARLAKLARGSKVVERNVEDVVTKAVPDLPKVEPKALNAAPSGPFPVFGVPGRVLSEGQTPKALTTSLPDNALPPGRYATEASSIEGVPRTGRIIDNVTGNISELRPAGRPMGASPIEDVITGTVDDLGMTQRDVFSSVGIQRHFAETIDDVTGVVVRQSVTPEADAAIKALSLSPTPMRSHTPFKIEQNEFMNGPGGKGVVLKWDIEPQREPLLTSNLLKKSADEVEEIVSKGEGIKMGEVVIIEKSADARIIEDVVEKGLGMQGDEIATIVKQADVPHMLQPGDVVDEGIVKSIARKGDRILIETPDGRIITRAGTRVKKKEADPKTLGKSDAPGLVKKEFDKGPGGEVPTGLKRPRSKTSDAEYKKQLETEMGIPQVGEVFEIGGKAILQTERGGSMVPEGMKTKEKAKWIKEELKRRCKRG